jgi:hypothetical protein
MQQKYLINIGGELYEFNEDELKSAYLLILALASYTTYLIQVNHCTDYTLEDTIKKAIFDCVQLIDSSSLDIEALKAVKKLSKIYNEIEANHSLTFSKFNNN